MFGRLDAIVVYALFISSAPGVFCAAPEKWQPSDYRKEWRKQSVERVAGQPHHREEQPEIYYEDYHALEQFALNKETDDLGNTMLHQAVHRHDTIRFRYLLKILNKEMAKASWLDVKNEKEQTPLLLAVKRNHYTFAHALTKHGADTNTKDTTGNTPLHYAAMNNDTKCVRFLLQHGANKAAVNNGNAQPCDALFWKHDNPRQVLFNLLNVHQPQRASTDSSTDDSNYRSLSSFLDSNIKIEQFYETLSSVMEKVFTLSSLVGLNVVELDVSSRFQQVLKRVPFVKVLGKGLEKGDEFSFERKLKKIEQFAGSIQRRLSKFREIIDDFVLQHHGCLARIKDVSVEGKVKRLLEKARKKLNRNKKIAARKLDKLDLASYSLNAAQAFATHVFSFIIDKVVEQTPDELALLSSKQKNTFFRNALENAYAQVKDEYVEPQTQTSGSTLSRSTS